MQPVPLESLICKHILRVGIQAHRHAKVQCASAIAVSRCVSPLAHIQTEHNQNEDTSLELRIIWNSEYPLQCNLATKTIRRDILNGDVYI